MGGFEGGDEAGFWDNHLSKKSTRKENYHKPEISFKEGIYSIKAYAKSNTVDKNTPAEDKKLGQLTPLKRLSNLFDTIAFVPSSTQAFTIQGCEAIPKESNTIYKAYLALLEYTKETEIEDFFQEHTVLVTKQIPLSLGHAGSASNAAAFLHLVKEACNLVLSVKELATIGRSIDKVTPFFIYNYPLAFYAQSGDILTSLDT